jgi:3-methyladenine DNA glycosylase Tag
MRKFLIKQRIIKHNHVLNDLYEKYKKIISENIVLDVFIWKLNEDEKEIMRVKTNAEIIAEISCIRRMKKLLKKFL